MAPRIQRRAYAMAILILSVGLLLASCALLPGADGEAIQVEVVRSEKVRITSPDVNLAELDELVAGNNAFAFDLFQTIRESDANLFYSPYSISVALAMTYAGARRDTEVQMADTLRFTLSQDRLHPAFNALKLDLASRNELPEGWDGEGFALNVVNSIWGQIGYSFLSAFLDILAENYGAGLRLLDFINVPKASRIAINDWVSRQTEDKINDLLPPRSITADTRLVLTNAIYFNAAWLHPFETEATHEGAFHLLNGAQVTVPMMEQQEFFRYTQGDGYQAVELPYNGEALAMVILLPETGAFRDFEQSLTAKRFSSIVSHLERGSIHLTMPKFTYDSSFSLRESLAKMGMPDAFHGGLADFSGMDGTRNLFISDVIHKAFVSVDEIGTEAAAATAVVVSLTAAPTAVEVTIDRPFLFAIRDVATGTILFLGRVLYPGVR